MDNSKEPKEEVLFKGNIVDAKGRESPVLITPQRVMIGNVTYSTANITSVTIAKSKPSRRMGITIAVIGIIITILAFILSAVSPGYDFDIFTQYLLGFGLFLIVIGSIMTFFARGRSYLGITTAAGEVPAFWSHDRELIQQLVSHIEKAIVLRG